MIKKVIIVFALTLSLVLAKDTGFLKSANNSIMSSANNTEVVVDHQQLQLNNRDIITLYEDDFEGDIEWTYEEWWELSEDEYSSPTHSFNAPNSPGGVNNGSWLLFSPVIPLPPIGDDEIMRFGFDLFVDQPDFDGDLDNSLEDLYRVAIADVDALAWHTTDFNAYSGMSYWCGDEDLQGYSDGWLQFLDTPPITIPGIGYQLTTQLKWGIEDPCGGDCGVAGVFVDGWDAANVRISTDGGSTWEAIEGSDPYDFTSGYGWVHNGEAEYIPGWGGQQDWHEVTFDLTAYADQEVIIRFAFGSDPAYSTIDDASLIGFFVDDIVVESLLGDELFFADADQTEEPMVAAGLAWIEQFYDYGDVDRPGALGWEEYLPGLAYNGNVFLDISDFSEKNVKFKFTAVYDDNDDGGTGQGLFIDDFKIYKETGAPPAPTGLAGEAMDSQNNLWWDDMNYAGTDDFIYDNDVVSDMITLTNEGEAWAGASYDIVGPSMINSLSIYNINEPGTVVTVGVFEKAGAFYNLNATFEMEVTLSDGWNEFTPGWEVNGAYIIGYTFTDLIAAGLDTSTGSSLHSWSFLGGSWDSWANTVEGSGGALNHGEWGIRANITQYGADVTYNLYRDGNVLTSELVAAYYEDEAVENNITYSYSVSAVFPAGEESELSAPIELTPQSNTVYELAHDDGSAEGDATIGSANFMAVRFTANGAADDLVRLKWYQNGDGGAFYFYIWEDDGGLPGVDIYHHIVVGGVDGWNSYDVDTEGIVLGGDFWVGVKEFSSTQPYGLDTDSDTGNSYYRIGTGGDWAPLSDNGMAGNLMIRSLLDGGEVPTCEIGDVNDDGNVDVLDIVQIVNFIMNGVTPTEQEACASDANEDGTIDVLDIVFIVNMIMGG